MVFKWNSSKAACAHWRYRLKCAALTCSARSQHVCWLQRIHSGRIHFIISHLNDCFIFLYWVLFKLSCFIFFMYVSVLKYIFIYTYTHWSLIFSNVIIQPTQRNTCRHRMFLQTTDLLELWIWHFIFFYVATLLFFTLNVQFLQSCATSTHVFASAVVPNVLTPHEKHPVVSRLLMLQHSLEQWSLATNIDVKLSLHLVENLQWFHAYKCWHPVSTSGLWQQGLE